MKLEGTLNCHICKQDKPLNEVTFIATGSDKVVCIEGCEKETKDETS